MQTLSKPPEFYDADYYERGRETGKSWLVNYRWMPQRSFREALSVIDYLGLDTHSYLLDFGCAKGFLVRAMRQLEIRADGCDVSQYALSFAPEGCWNCEGEWPARGYTHIFTKDVFEHFQLQPLIATLRKLQSVAPSMMAVVPMGDNGTYRIPEYALDASHIIAEDEDWWARLFETCGWRVLHHCRHVPGIKDNWKDHAGGRGNHVFRLFAPLAGPVTAGTHQWLCRS